MIWTAAFWRGTGERVLKTFIEVFVPTTIAALGATAEGVLNAWTAPWLVAVQTGTGLALGASAIAFLIAVGNADFVAGVTGGGVVASDADVSKDLT